MGKLRDWFTVPTQEEIWQQLVNEINQEKSGITAQVAQGENQNKVIKASVGEWTVTLDNVTVMIWMGKMMIPMTHTRIRAPYVNQDGLRFNVHRAGLFSGISKYFGMQDIEVGHELFDKEFIVQGTDEAKIRALLAQPKIVELLRAQPDIGTFEVKDDDGWFDQQFPEGVDELVFTSQSKIDDFTQLKQLFVLFGEVLNQLCAIGSAYKKKPTENL